MSSGFEHWDEETTLTWQRDEHAGTGGSPSPPTLRGVGPAEIRARAAERMPAALTKTDVWDAVAYWDSTERSTAQTDIAAAFERANLGSVDDADSEDRADSDPGEGPAETASRGLFWTGITLVMVTLLVISLGTTIVAGA